VRRATEPVRRAAGLMRAGPAPRAGVGPRAGVAARAGVARRPVKPAPWRGAPARRARGPRILLGLLAGLILVLVIAVLAGSGGGTGRPAPPAATGLAAGTGTPAARWLAGPAGRLLSAVSADLGRLSAAERAGQAGAARLAGTRLSADAKAALAGPAPPLAARRYRSALAELERAGRSAASGRFQAADASLRAGEGGLTKATALANAPATAGLPGAAIPEPAG
jgi:hypothetical protein